MLHVTTFNVGSAPDNVVEKDLNRLAADNDVLTLNEMGDRDHVHIAGFTIYTGKEAGAARDRIAVRDGLDVTAHGWYFAAPLTDVGPTGAGPTHLGPKYICWVTIRLNNGTHVTIGCMHMPPSVQTGNWFRGKAKRIAMFIKMVRAMRRWRMDHPGHLIIAGDMNATLKFPPLRLGFRPLNVATRPSFGKRAIDQQWFRRLELTWVGALDGYHSDHRPVAAKYRLPVQP